MAHLLSVSSFLSFEPLLPSGVVSVLGDSCPTVWPFKQLFISSKLYLLHLSVHSVHIQDLNPPKDR